MILYVCAAFLFGLAMGCWWSWIFYRRNYDGFMHVEELSENHKVFSLVLLAEPESLEDKNMVVFKVKHTE